jgi:hypothetical protein
LSVPISHTQRNHHCNYKKNVCAEIREKYVKQCKREGNNIDTSFKGVRELQYKRSLHVTSFGQLIIFGSYCTEMLIPSFSKI